jgi:outer membrane protein TolC
MAGLRLNYTLYDGDHTNAAIALAEARLRETRAQLARTELALDLEVQQAELDYNQAGQRLQVTEKMVAAASETARLSRERFKEGVILAIDLIDVETRLSDALARRSSAKSMHQIARANLRRAMGLPQFDEDGATEKEIAQ